MKNKCAHADLPPTRVKCPQCKKAHWKLPVAGLGRYTNAPIKPAHSGCLSDLLERNVNSGVGELYVVH